jgi:hypothetical protein
LDATPRLGHLQCRDSGSAFHLGTALTHPVVSLTNGLPAKVHVIAFAGDWSLVRLSQRQRSCGSLWALLLWHKRTMKQNSWRHLLFLRPGGHHAVNRVIDGGMMEGTSPPSVALRLVLAGPHGERSGRTPCCVRLTWVLRNGWCVESLAAPAQAAHALRPQCLKPWNQETFQSVLISRSIKRGHDSSGATSSHSWKKLKNLSYESTGMRA